MSLHINQVTVLLSSVAVTAAAGQASGSTLSSVFWLCCHRPGHRVDVDVSALGANLSYHRTMSRANLTWLHWYSTSKVSFFLVVRSFDLHPRNISTAAMPVTLSSMKRTLRHKIGDRASIINETIRCNGGFLTQRHSGCVFAYAPSRATRGLDALILKSSLQLLLITHLANSLHEVLFYHIVPLSTNSKHTLKYESDFYTRKSRNELKSTNRFCANISKICSIEAISELANRLVVNITMLGDWSSMDLEYFEPTLFSKRDELGHMKQDRAVVHENHLFIW